MDVNNENPHTILVRAVKNMDMQLVCMLIVDNDLLPKGVCEKDFKILIRNAALLNNGPLLRQLFKYNSMLGGEVLVSMLHNFEVAITLIMAGAELNIRDISTAATPLYILLASDYPRKFELAELMYDRGAICDNAYEYGRHSAVKCAIKAGAPEDFLRKIVRIAIAESDERQDLMLLLITAGPEQGAARSPKARIAIFHLLESATYNTEVVRALLEYDLPVDTLDQNGNTVLHREIQMANTEAELYLQRGADPNRKTWRGILPLWVASSMEDSSMATILIRYGADVHDYSTNGQRPIHGACKGHSLSNVLLLIRLGADSNVVSEKGATPLSLVAEKDSPNKDALYAFVLRQLALVASRGESINDHDIRAIRMICNRQNLFDLSFQELQRMQRMEADEGIPYYTFLIGNINRTSSFVRRNDFTDIFENQARLKALFPSYFCDLQNAYVFAKEREGLLIAKEQSLNEIFSEAYQVPVPDLVVNKVANYLCFGALNNFHARFSFTHFSQHDLGIKSVVQIFNF